VEKLSPPASISSTRTFYSMDIWVSHAARVSTQASADRDHGRVRGGARKMVALVGMESLRRHALRHEQEGAICDYELLLRF
jgi:hypothetical protein